MRFPILQPGQRTNQQSSSAWNHMIQMVQRVANLDVVFPLRKAVHAGGIRIKLDESFLVRPKSAAEKTVVIVGIAESVLLVREVQYADNPPESERDGAVAFVGPSFEAYPWYTSSLQDYQDDVHSGSTVDRDVAMFRAIKRDVWLVVRDDDVERDDAPLRPPHFMMIIDGVDRQLSRDSTSVAGAGLVPLRNLKFRPRARDYNTVDNSFRNWRCYPGYVLGDYVDRGLAFSSLPSGDIQPNKKFRLMVYTQPQFPIDSEALITVHLQRP